MDDFKKANTNEYTASDLNCNCVCTSPKTKKRLKQIYNKKARRKVNMIIIDEFVFED